MASSGLAANIRDSACQSGVGAKVGGPYSIGPDNTPSAGRSAARGTTAADRFKFGQRRHESPSADHLDQHRLAVDLLVRGGDVIA